MPSDQRDRETEALRERLSRLSAASWRINDSLRRRGLEGSSRPMKRRCPWTTPATVDVVGEKHS